MNILHGLLGYPLESKEFGTLNPIKVRDMVENDGIQLFLNVVEQTQEDLWDATAIQKGETPEGIRYEETPSPYQLMCIYLMTQNGNINKGARAILGGRELYFSKDADGILMLDPSNMTDLSSVTILDENNYLDFQNTIRAILGKEAVEAPDPNEHPKLSRFKAKSRYREAIASKSKGDSLTLPEIIVAVCCMHPSITPLNVGELSYPALIELFGKLNAKEAYDTQVRAATSGFGGGSLKGLKSWMKNQEK